MNQYGRMALDYTSHSRPTAFAQIEDPERFFTEVGEEIERAIVGVRDQILGDPRPGESPEEYRRRSYQAWGTAEELVLADHWLLVAEPEIGEDGPDTTDDPELEDYYRTLAIVNEPIIDPNE